MAKIKINNQLKGFSLVEIIVVLAIIGLLVGIAIPAILAAQRSSRQTAQEAVMNTIRTGYSSNFTKTAFRSFIIAPTNNLCPTSVSSTAYAQTSTVNPNSRFFIVSTSNGSNSGPGVSIECFSVENRSQFNIHRLVSGTCSDANNRSDGQNIRFIDNGTTLFYCTEDGSSKEFPYRS